MCCGCVVWCVPCTAPYVDEKSVDELCENYSVIYNIDYRIIFT